MARRYPTEAKNIQVDGLAGSTRVRFRGSIPHGKSTRQVAIDVHPELIVQIAAALVATKDCACDNEFTRRHRHHSEYGWQPGHAIWHVDNPDRPMPCIHHDKPIIDVPVQSVLPSRHNAEKGDECETCLGVGRIRDGETAELRRCLDCNGQGTRAP